jgi:putative addiction module killer protein
MIEVIQYIDEHGRNPFERWLKDLDLGAKVRVSFQISRLENGNIPAKSVGQGVLELRLNFGPGYRIYLGRDGDELVILLGGGTKQRQSADIETAQSLWREYKERKRKD